MEEYPKIETVEDAYKLLTSDTDITEEMHEDMVGVFGQTLADDGGKA